MSFPGLCSMPGAYPIRLKSDQSVFENTNTILLHWNQKERRIDRLGSVPLLFVNHTSRSDVTSSKDQLHFSYLAIAHESFVTSHTLYFFQIFPGAMEMTLKELYCFSSRLVHVERPLVT